MHTLEVLDKLAFFRGLTDEEKETVGNLQLRIFRYHPGSIIIRKGDLDGDLFVILKGTATVVGNRSLPLAILKSGDVFGEVSFLSQGRARTADVVSNGEVIVMRLDQQAFASLEGPLREKLKDKLIKILIDRLVTPQASVDVSFNWTHAGPDRAQ
ncbi:MAG: cyclic nucleotide-binding domain-containing protein [Magnetococcales bacterium]|nr:cyclic nucleotide-binding domain-containing protein [Magnetococcales bacterium]